MNTPGHTPAEGARAGPSPEWRALFEVWSARSLDLAIPPERLSPESRRLLSIAGALCYAIMMGEVRSEVAPESASLLDVARGWAVPATPLQRAWLEYQDLCLSHARQVHADVSAAAASTERSLPQKVSDFEAERQQVLVPVCAELQAAITSLARLRTDLVDKTTALNEARHSREDAHERLICMPARKLGDPIPSEVEHLLEQRQTAESAFASLELAVVRLRDRINQELKRVEDLKAVCDVEERRFKDRVSQAQDALRQLRREAEGFRTELVVPFAGSHPRKRDSFAYLHIRSNRSLAAHHSTFPSMLDAFESRGAGLWTLRGQSCHKEALQLAFPEAIQGEAEPTERPYLDRWTLDAALVPARDQERIEPLLTAMRSVLCCATSLDAYFALDWYKAHNELTNQWHNSEVGEMVFQAKYHGRRDLVATLAARLSEFIRVHPLYSSARLVAAVPCLPSKQYDLPRHLCATLATVVNKVDATGALHKVRETKPMKDIDDHAEKLANVSQAFSADAFSIAGDDVIIVDDTYGSGITLWEVARTLRNAGAGRVLGLTCAKNRSFR